MGIVRDRFNNLVAVEYKPTTINNVNDPALLAIDEFVSLTNVDLLDDGAIQRREGYSVTLAASSHSGWSNSSATKAFVVQDSILYGFDGTSVVQITTLQNNNRCCFCEVNNVVVYSNGLDYGIIEDGVSYGPVLPDLEFKITPKAGQCLEFYNGRLYIGSENIVYCTDPFTVDYADERHCVVFDANSKITMIRRTDDGLFIGTETEIFYLSGNDVQEGLFTAKNVANYGCILGTDVFVNGEYVKDGSGTSALWCSTRGVCYGGSGGSFRNLTNNYYTYEYGYQGSAIIRFRNSQIHYIANTNSGDAAFNQNIPITLDVDSI